MNCPKCGFVQEERADCRKCGVVFAKFFALHAADCASPMEPADSPVPLKGPYEEYTAQEVADLVELRQGLRDLQHRFKELEFERAERKRMQGEIRAMDDRVQAVLDQLGAHQQRIEQNIAELAATQPAALEQGLADLRLELRDLDVEAIHRRIDWMENSLSLNAGEMCARSELQPLEQLPGMDARLTEVEHRLTEILESRGPNASNGTQTQVEGAVKTIEEMRAALQAVTIRYTEIGELKKNHLVLRNLCESLQQALDASRKESAAGNSARIREIQNEMSALRAEVRKAYERMDLLETQPAPAAPGHEAATREDLVSLRNESATASQYLSEERARMDSKIDALRAEVAVFNREVTCLRQELLEARSQMKSMQEQDDGIKTVAPGGATVPTSADMVDIRDHLGEIRRFMASLSRKL